LLESLCLLISFHTSQFIAALIAIWSADGCLMFRKNGFLLLSWLGLVSL
jgi:hypothetical protein